TPAKAGGPGALGSRFLRGCNPIPHIPPLRPFARRSREGGNPGISVACPPVHARGRLWVPAFAGTTNCPYAGFLTASEAGLQGNCSSLVLGSRGNDDFIRSD